MGLFANGGFLFIISFVTICSANNNENEGFLKATCNEAKDCYVIDNSSHGLHLACWHNVHRCKCVNTFRSDFHLKWENGQCLMSKYGPCGEKGTDLAVGCQNGFVCVENQCRDPKDNSAKSVKQVPLIFEESDCSSNHCQFSEDLHLTCNGGNHCSCQKVYVADLGDTYWDIRNYDDDHNCSVGKFGPCGKKDGITIECHGDGITCVSGTCLNASHPISDIGEDCGYTRNCREGLQCSLDRVCIEPNSLGEGKRCSGTMHCRAGLQCRRSGPWSSAFCRHE